jgi:1,4-alpha-glucan branching enzyme
MKTYKLAFALFFMLFCAVLAAQNQPQPQTQGRPAVLPPYEILPDRQVTFRIAAPQAASVELHGDWPGGLGGRTTAPMVKDDKGVWSVTAGPLPSDLWTYSFTADGVNAAPVEKVATPLTRWARFRTGWKPAKRQSEYWHPIWTTAK